MNSAAFRPLASFNTRSLMPVRLAIAESTSPGRTTYSCSPGVLVAPSVPVAPAVLGPPAVLVPPAALGALAGADALGAPGVLGALAVLDAPAPLGAPGLPSAPAVLVAPAVLGAPVVLGAPETLGESPAGGAVNPATATSAGAPPATSARDAGIGMRTVSPRATACVLVQPFAASNRFKETPLAAAT